MSSLDAARLPLPHRTKLRQLGYVPGAAEWRSSVIITEYSGAASVGEVLDARNEYARRYTSTQYSEIESFAIDSRPALGWQETQSIDGRVVSMGFTAVVAYKDVTYSIEYSSSDARSQGPQHLREVVMSFRVVRNARSEGVVFVLAGLALAGILLYLLRSGRGAPASGTDTVDRLLSR